jgi:hypothetical protein
LAAPETLITLYPATRFVQPSTTSRFRATVIGTAPAILGSERFGALIGFQIYRAAAKFSEILPSQRDMQLAFSVTMSERLLR